MVDNVLADKIGELGTSLASIKEQVQNLGSDLTAKVKAGGEASAELKTATDKALSELGDVTTRLSDLEKRAAREKEAAEDCFKSIGDMVIESAAYKAGNLTGASRAAIKVSMDRAAITSANGTVGTGRSVGTSLIPGQRVAGIFGLPERQLTIRDLLLPGQTSSNSVEYVKETGYTNSAAPVAETTAKPVLGSDVRHGDCADSYAGSPVQGIAPDSRRRSGAEELYRRPRALRSEVCRREPASQRLRLRPEHPRPRAAGHSIRHPPSRRLMLLPSTASALLFSRSSWLNTRQLRSF